MGRTYAIFLAALSCFFSVATAMTCVLPQTLPAKTRVVFILDTSGSMRGIGDGKANIFDAVKASMDEYIQEVKPDQIELMTFSNGLKTRNSYQFPAQAAAWKTDLDALKANGNNTYLYRSMTAALAPLEGREQYITNVFVLTDGIDNEPRRRTTAVSSLASFTGRGSFDRLTYIALGTDIPPLARRALRESDYASGVTLPVGQRPKLIELAGVQVKTVTEPTLVLPYAAGTPIQLSHVPHVNLVESVVNAQQEVKLAVTSPTTVAALLCAAPESTWVAPRVRHTILRVALPLLANQHDDLVLLNPGSRLQLVAGQGTILRYWSRRPLTELSFVTGSDALEGRLQRFGNSRFFNIHLKNTGKRHETVVAYLQWGSEQMALPALELGAGNIAAASSQQINWLWLLLPFGVFGLIVLVRIRQRIPWQGVIGVFQNGLQTLKTTFNKLQAGKKSQATEPSVKPDALTLDYRADRSLILQKDGKTSRPFSFEGTLDLGKTLPTLAGLTVQQQANGLQLQQIPDGWQIWWQPDRADAAVKDERLYPNDIVLPATVLKLVRVTPSRLGSLQGLGRPLRLKTQGQHLHMTGPYGTHSLVITTRVDLGKALGAQLLHGLVLEPNNDRLFLIQLPDDQTVKLCDLDTKKPLQTGTYLPSDMSLIWNS